MKKISGSIAGVFLPGIFWVIAFSAFLGCVSKPVGEPFYTRLFVGTYDEVWTAALKALNEYPLKLSNKDSGRIISEVVNGPYNEVVLSYPDPIELPERFRYNLDFNFAKLVGDDRQPLVRVRVRKGLEKFHDFYTGWLAFPSDGLEEKVLLYRIENILRMEKLLSAG